MLRVNLGAYHDNLDPQKAAFVNEIAVLQLAYEGLTRFDPNGNVIPAQAERWTVAPDGKTITFTLRADLKRADGAAITASDFVTSFKRLVDPRVGGEYNTLLDDVVGAAEARTSDPRAIQADFAKTMNAVGVKATGDLTLTVSLKQPAGYWPAVAATWAGLPADSRAVAKDPQYWWTKAREPQWQRAIHDRPDRRGQPHRSGGQPQLLGRPAEAGPHRVLLPGRPGRCPASLPAGQIDVTPLSAQDLITATADASLKQDLLTGPVGWTTFLAMNAKRSPFDEKAVRAAFSQALDREGFAQNLLAGQGKPYLSFLPPGIPGYDPTALQEGYDPKAAVQKLVDAGYGASRANKSDPPKIDCKVLGEVKLTFPDTARNRARYQFLSNNLARSLAVPSRWTPWTPAPLPP